ESLRFRGSASLGAAQPIILRGVELESDQLTAMLDTRLENGQTSVAGAGRHAEYGPFDIDAVIEGEGVNAQLVLADPYPAAGLSDVRIGIAPSDTGFVLDVAGGSLLGAFDGTLGLVLPAQGPVRLDIDRLNVFRTGASGSLTFAQAGLKGNLTLAGGGLAGTAAIAPASEGATGFDVDLTADRARFGGETPIALRAADIEASGQFGGQAPSQISAAITGSGLQYGALRLASFAADARIEDGVGQVTGTIAGRRADRFALKIDGDVAPRRVSLLVRGEYAGRRITMPRRAVFTSIEEGGYSLAPAQIGFGRGYAILEGQIGGETTDISAKLARMPLLLADLAGAELGLSGRLSGVVSLTKRGQQPATGNVRIKVDDFARSGLVLSSTPLDLVLAADLEPDALVAAARFDSGTGELGRLDARITGLGQASGTVMERLRRGRLEAVLRYKGAAEALWRLAAVETFDLTGPVSITAKARGTLADPRFTGDLTTDNLRLQSAASGTDLTGVSARGRFTGSRLELSRFAGTTAGGGTVSGSGTVDLAAMSGERGPSVDLRLSARKARLLSAAGLEATLSGPLRIVSSGVGGTIAGRVTVESASWRLGYAAQDMALPDIATREVGLSEFLDVETPANPNRWRYLVDAKAPGQLEVYGLGLNSEWSADLQIRGEVADPRIGGEANLVRGTYRFAGTQFDLSRGRIRFDAGGPIDPRLDLEAEAQASDTTVTIDITGTSAAPQIAFTSQPVLPDEEILARLLFGGSVTSLSAAEALQLGAALAALRQGGGGLDPIGELRRSIGLDQLRIISADPALGRATGVALGKNITRRFYVELVTDGRGYSATQVEYRITRWLALLGTVTTIGRDNVSAQISRDY
ncbi:MAG: translocation/assembly module TamB domain-containing protein, partial [Pseudomonadota bacterium]